MTCAGNIRRYAVRHVVSWMRAQSGTSSLRAMLYLDEVAGYMPPVAIVECSDRGEPGGDAGETSP